jgi:hypothetical protein
MVDWSKVLNCGSGGFRFDVGIQSPEGFLRVKHSSKIPLHHSLTNIISSGGMFQWLYKLSRALTVSVALTTVLLLLLLRQIWTCNQKANQRFRLDFLRTTLRSTNARSTAPDTVSNSTALPLLTQEEAAAQAIIRGNTSSPPIPPSDGASTASTVALAAASTSTAAEVASQAGNETAPMTPEEVAAAAEVTTSPPVPAATAADMP